MASKLLQLHKLSARSLLESLWKILWKTSEEQGAWFLR